MSQRKTVAIKLIANLLLLMPMLALATDTTGPREPTEEERAVIEAGVKSKLRDADSAQFRGIKIGPDQKQTLMACGEVNSKNAYGGYVGFSKFTAMLIQRDGKIAAAILIGIDSRNQVIADQCAQIGM
jgi:hypothetical protein